MEEHPTWPMTGDIWTACLRKRQQRQHTVQLSVLRLELSIHRLTVVFVVLCSELTTLPIQQSSGDLICSWQVILDGVKWLRFRSTEQILGQAIVNLGARSLPASYVSVFEWMIYRIRYDYRGLIFSRFICLVFLLEYPGKQNFYRRFYFDCFVSSFRLGWILPAICCVGVPWWWAGLTRRPWIRWRPWHPNWHMVLIYLWDVSDCLRKDKYLFLLLNTKLFANHLAVFVRVIFAKYFLVELGFISTKIIAAHTSREDSYSYPAIRISFENIHVETSFLKLHFRYWV